MAGRQTYLGELEQVVLLATCATVAGMLLSRAAGRSRELSLRAAIGARRGRLVQQLLTETVVLSLAGGAAGLVRGNCLLRSFIATIPPAQRAAMPHLDGIGLEPSVTERTREIGIHVALGATRRSIFRLVLQKGLLATALGLAVGLGAAIAVAHLLRALLFDVAPGDPLVLAGAAGFLTAVAVLACLIPAAGRAGLTGPAGPLTALGNFYYVAVVSHGHARHPRRLRADGTARHPPPGR